MQGKRGEGFPFPSSPATIEGREGEGGFFGSETLYPHMYRIHTVCTGKGTAFFSSVDMSLGLMPYMMHGNERERRCALVSRTFEQHTTRL